MLRITDLKELAEQEWALRQILGFDIGVDSIRLKLDSGCVYVITLDDKDQVVIWEETD